MIVTYRQPSRARLQTRLFSIIGTSSLCLTGLLGAPGCVSDTPDGAGDDTSSPVNGTDTQATSEPPDSSDPEDTSEGTDSASSDEPSAAPSSDDTASLEPGDPAAFPDVVVGTFAIELAGDTTGVQGKVKNGEDSANMIWDTALTVGDCELRVPRIPSCAPTCADTDACVDENTCRVIPTSVSVGDVLVSGVSHDGSKDAVKLRSIVKNYQTPADVIWDAPPFAPGDPITLSASGGDLAPFEIGARGISPIAVTSEPPELAANVPIDISWEAESGEIETAIYVRIDVSHHGGTRGLIECETPDDGELSIDGSLAKGLMDQGVSGFPNIRITRSNIGSVATAVGVVQLKVNSIVQQDLTIEGLASCNTTDECAEGLTCETDRVCR